MTDEVVFHMLGYLKVSELGDTIDRFWETFLWDKDKDTDNYTVSDVEEYMRSDEFKEIISWIDRLDDTYGGYYSYMLQLFREERDGWGNSIRDDLLVFKYNEELGEELPIPLGEVDIELPNYVREHYLYSYEMWLFLNAKAKGELIQ